MMSKLSLVVTAAVASCVLVCSGSLRAGEPEQPAGVPRDAEQLEIALKVFELTMADGEAGALPGFQDAVDGKISVMTPENGENFFHRERRGLDILSAPVVTVLPGQQARVEVVREFVYPEGYDEDSESGTLAPTEFATVNTGVMIDVTASPTGDPDVVQLDLKPLIREFKGFVASEKIEGTEEPVFETLTKSISGRYQNGTYFIIGHREDKQFIEDKVPILGDIPVLGRIFRSEETLEVVGLVAVQVVVSEVEAGE